MRWMSISARGATDDVEEGVATWLPGLLTCVAESAVVAKISPRSMLSGKCTENRRIAAKWAIRLRPTECETLWEPRTQRRLTRLNCESFWGSWELAGRLRRADLSVVPNYAGESLEICAFWCDQTGLYPKSTHRHPQKTSASTLPHPKSTPRGPQEVSGTSPYPLAPLAPSDCRTTLFLPLQLFNLSSVIFKIARRPCGRPWSTVI